eukprot:gnl/TRDRNA2_/TRDRNA2_161542_c0_seq1.p1 gnl/TRDRNA2_/TRDRNA2_161542_c0~~gnl/TRDRNA2_/TRDRNA2_161542_c0_seq1.p1  ORF type:complete len:117 (+),score=33.24 gnl/TRDRNA2_/TRDRNA2_161542_c0_seq1:157-507(+)
MQASNFGMIRYQRSRLLSWCSFLLAQVLFVRSVEASFLAARLKANTTPAEAQADAERAEAKLKEAGIRKLDVQVTGADDALHTTKIMKAAAKAKAVAVRLAEVQAAAAKAGAKKSS